MLPLILTVLSFSVLSVARAETTSPAPSVDDVVGCKLFEDRGSGSERVALNYLSRDRVEEAHTFKNGKASIDAADAETRYLISVTTRQDGQLSVRFSYGKNNEDFVWKAERRTTLLLAQGLVEAKNTPRGVSNIAVADMIVGLDGVESASLWCTRGAKEQVRKFLK